MWDINTELSFPSHERPNRQFTSPTFRIYSGPLCSVRRESLCSSKHGRDSQTKKTVRAKAGHYRCVVLSISTTDLSAPDRYQSDFFAQSGRSDLKSHPVYLSMTSIPMDICRLRRDHTNTGADISHFCTVSGSPWYSWIMVLNIIGWPFDVLTEKWSNMAELRTNHEYTLDNLWNNFHSASFCSDFKSRIA